MSAITGIFYRDRRKVEQELIKKMNNRLSHRGPDGSAVYCDGPVALGHQMLWTTPESLYEKLPFHDEISGLVITADARIDNRKELSEKLGIEVNEEVSDSYYILKAFEKWGEKCPEHLLGDFAFAIWDINNEKLFCARDHMGVKPFYYYLSDSAFFFATDLKALLIQEIPCQLNEIRVADYLIFLVEDCEITFYNEIKRLPAAHRFNINSDMADKTCYWELDPDKETLMGSDEEYANKFLEIFTEAVKCRLRSTFNLGTFLSGGLDSSSITCTARKLILEKNSEDMLKTFSSVFDDFPICDEKKYINKVLKVGNLEPYLIITDDISPLSQINKVLKVVGEPFNIPTYYSHWEIFKKAKEKDVRILLDGFDGDVVVFYEERYALDLAREMHWRKLISEIKCMAKARGINSNKMFLYAVILPLIPKSFQTTILQRLLDFMNINLNLSEDEHFDFIKKDFVQITNVKNRFNLMFKKPLEKSNTNKLRHHLRLSSSYLQYALENLDKVAANSSIENRYPFFDRRLVEFCLSLPKEQKYSKMWDRIVMRRAMDGILPKEIQWHTTKTGIGIHFKTSMLKIDKNILEQAIYEDGHLVNKYVDLKKLKRGYKEYEKNVESSDAIDIWLSVVLIIWLKNRTQGNLF